MTSRSLNTYCDVTQCMNGLWIFITKHESPKDDSQTWSSPPRNNGACVINTLNQCWPSHLWQHMVTLGHNELMSYQFFIKCLSSNLFTIVSVYYSTKILPTAYSRQLSLSNLLALMFLTCILHDQSDCSIISNTRTAWTPLLTICAFENCQPGRLH